MRQVAGKQQQFSGLGAQTAFQAEGWRVEQFPMCQIRARGDEFDLAGRSDLNLGLRDIVNAGPMRARMCVRRV